MTIEILMIVGFCLAAYSIVGNDVPQTLGTFISSNAHRPWWMLWLYTSSILTLVLLYGWWASGIGDASYGRLETIPFPATGITWLYIVPPSLTDSFNQIWHSCQYYIFGADHFLAQQFGSNAHQVNDGLCSCFCGRNHCLPLCD